MILSFIGVVIVISHGHTLKGLSTLFNNIGDFAALGGAVCWAIYLFAVKYKPYNLSFAGFAYSTFSIGTNILFPVYLFDILYLNHVSILTITNIAVIFCLGFGVSIIGMMSLNFTISNLGSNISAILFYLAPLFTALLAILILDEEFRLYHLAGITFILSGINLPLIVGLFNNEK